MYTWNAKSALVDARGLEESGRTDQAIEPGLGLGCFGFLLGWLHGERRITGGLVECTLSLDLWCGVASGMRKSRSGKSILTLPGYLLFWG